MQLIYWQEFIEIPWYAHLPQGSFVYDPATQRYGFQEGFVEGDLVDDFLNEPDNVTDREESGDVKMEHLKDKSGGIYTIIIILFPCMCLLRYHVLIISVLGGGGVFK